MHPIFVKLLALYTRHEPPRLHLRRWGAFAASAALAGASAAPVYRTFDLPLRYPEPIVGNAAWALGTKFHDYAVPLSVVAVFLASLAFIDALLRRIEMKAGPETEARFHSLLCIAAAPAGAWFTGLLTTKNDSLFLLNLSGVAIAALLVYSMLLSLRPTEFWRTDEPQFVRILQQVLLLLLAACLGVAATAVGISRLLALRHAAFSLESSFVHRAAIVAFVVAAISAAALLLASPSSKRIEHSLRRFLLLAQLPFPAFFLLLVPRPWIVDQRETLGYPLSTIGWAFIALCIAAAAWSLARRAIAYRQRSPDAPVETFSALSVIGALLFLKAPPIHLPFLVADDYHFGELIVPWWSLARHHMIPFADYAPARGLVNYLPGFATSIFFDGTASSLPAAMPFLYAAYLLIALPGLRLSIGLWPAFIALFLAPFANFISEIDLFVTVFLSFLGYGFSKWAPVPWLIAWVLCGTALVLFAPGQGGLAVLATAPLGLYSLTQSLRNHRRALMRALLILVGLAAVSAAFSPALRMVWAAVRYGLEQSASNSAAFGVAWKESFRSADANPWLFEAVRTSWLLASVWAGALLLRLRSASLEATRSTTVPYALPILILSTLFVFRAAGRIDPGPSRLGVASIWGLALLLPLLLIPSSRPHRRGGAIFVWLLLAGAIFPYFQGEGFGRFTHAFEPIASDSQALSSRVKGHTLGLPGIGTTFAEPSHISRLVAARRILDKVLDTDETYLDMTNRHAHYFYFDRRPPIECGSVYNLVSQGQQVRAVSTLQSLELPALLISADNILHDGGSVGLRSPLLYRFALSRRDYRVVTYSGQIWLIRKDRVSRISGFEGIAIYEHTDAPSNPIHQALRPPNLQSIPASWGISAGSLEPTMRLVHELPIGSGELIRSLHRDPGERFVVTGPSPLLKFDLSAFNLRGLDAGLLSFGFRCEQGRPKGAIGVVWSTDANPEGGDLTSISMDAHNGRLIVPLDSVPAWLLARRIRAISFSLPNSPQCSAFSLSDVRLYQRVQARLADAS